jgi:hypothetical protein
VPGTFHPHAPLDAGKDKDMLDKADAAPEPDTVTIDPDTGEIAPDEGDEAIDLEFGDADLPELGLETLKGDLRDALLSRFRMVKKPWEMLSEMEQRDVVNGMEMAAGHLVREAVRILTSHEFPHVVVKLSDMKVMGGDKGIECKISTTNISAHREALGDAVGDFVQVVMVDSAEFMGQRKEPEITPDQPEMDFGGEGETGDDGEGGDE